MTDTEKAKEIIEKIRYITIATSTNDGAPWNTPVYATHNEKFIFFWTSWHGTQHSQNIRKNPRVFISIYDSTVLEGKGAGIYIQARAEEIDDPQQLARIVPDFYAKKNKTPRKVEEFLGDSPRRMYKAIPEKVWMNLSSTLNGSPIDSRKEVTLI